MHVWTLFSDEYFMNVVADLQQCVTRHSREPERTGLAVCLRLRLHLKRMSERGCYEAVNATAVNVFTVLFNILPLSVKKKTLVLSLKVCKKRKKKHFI